MSGHLRILKLGTGVKKHDHFDLAIGEYILRLNDPRRFGAAIWHPNTNGLLEKHGLLKKLGFEPLDSNFSAEKFYQKTRNRQSAIKNVLLQGSIVVGVGNIYASESLFQAAIDPRLPANLVNFERYQDLVRAVREVLTTAIEKGGSTLRDFVGADGQPGFFQENHFVYNRAGLPCRICGKKIFRIEQGQRSTFYCEKCQSY